jgi:hypothetical protein
MPEVQKQQGETTDYVFSDGDFQEELACRSLLPVEKGIEKQRHLLSVAPLRSEGLFVCLGNTISEQRLGGGIVAHGKHGSFNKRQYFPSA